MPERLPEPVVVTVDGRAAVWSALDSLARPDDGDVAGGVLSGDEELVSATRELLSPASPVSSVLVLHPNVHYRFTESRDTLADVSAALLEAAGGRAVLSDSGWRHLNPYLPEDPDESGFAIH